MAKFNINDRVKVIGINPNNDFHNGRLGHIGIVQELDEIPFVLFEDGSEVCFLEEWLELIK